MSGLCERDDEHQMASHCVNGQLVFTQMKLRESYDFIGASQLFCPQKGFRSLYDVPSYQIAWSHVPSMGVLPYFIPHHSYLTIVQVFVSKCIKFFKVAFSTFTDIVLTYYIDLDNPYSTLFNQ